MLISTRHISIQQRLSTTNGSTQCRPSSLTPKIKLLKKWTSQIIWHVLETCHFLYFRWWNKMKQMSSIPYRTHADSRDLHGSPVYCTQCHLPCHKNRDISIWCTVHKTPFAFNSSAMTRHHQVQTVSCYRKSLGIFVERNQVKREGGCEHLVGPW